MNTERVKADLNEQVLQQTQDTFDKKSYVMSSMESTGLIPAEVLDEEQSESYQNLYDIVPQKPVPPGLQGQRSFKKSP